MRPSSAETSEPACTNRKMLSMNRSTACPCSRKYSAMVDRLAEQVEDPAQGDLAHRDGDRAAGVDDLHAAGQAVGGVHRHRAHAVVAEVLLDLADEVGAGAGADPLGLLGVRLALDDDRVVDLRQLVGEDGLDDDALDLLDPADVALAVRALLLLRCGGGGCHVPLTFLSTPAPLRRRRLP